MNNLIVEIVNSPHNDPIARLATETFRKSPIIYKRLTKVKEISSGTSEVPTKSKTAE